MKTRFNTYDITCAVTELKRYVGMRVNQIYDIDSKTYLIRLQKTDAKSIILLESGARIHTTAFEWPKNVAPSGFSMKMRKHLKNKRLENIEQVGVDRIVDLQFGTGEAAYHLILELYDRGNLILTDYQMIIQYVLRPHVEGDKFRFAIREKYPSDRARTEAMPPEEEIVKVIEQAKPNENLKKVLNPHLEFGAPLLDHVLLKHGLSTYTPNKILTSDNKAEEISKLIKALEEAKQMLYTARENPSKGYIIQKKETKASKDGEEESFILANVEFHPFLFEQIKKELHVEFESFDVAVDEYYSNMEGQKLDLKILNQEREALKKLDNVKKDHHQRLIQLENQQLEDKIKAELITRNQELVDKAILTIRSALASQISWPDINNLVKDAQNQGDPVALAIIKLQLETNHITLKLSDPYELIESESDEDNDEEKLELKPMVVMIDLGLSAYKNARKYYVMKKTAATKQRKTLESQQKALVSADKKTKQALKEVQVIHSINKLRKMYWFEKFYWFISSENYLVIGGRDQQQNEIIVKRYLKANDIYVHADVSGASSIVIKNPQGGPVPPKTLNEAGIMAVAYSIAWEAKVVVNAWWVNATQVSKTAPTGEYLTTGSFMIRGKKNYLPACQLAMGLSFMFRLEDTFIERHQDERKVRNANNELADEKSSDVKSEEQESIEKSNEESVETEINIEDSSDDEDAFPDTKVEVNIPISRISLEPVDHLNDNSNQDDNITIISSDAPVRRTQQYEKKNDRQKQTEQEVEKETVEKSNTANNTGLKRGQKSKLKKIKEKYKDQDEEDRRLLMEALQSAGSAKADKHKKGKKVQQSKAHMIKKGPKQPVPANDDKTDINFDDDDDDAAPQSETSLLNQLTGLPFADDELLFAVPVIAPYSALQNYKYKVKLTPGTAKRGKVAKTAVAIFFKDKTITAREKDLLKSVKDETIVRNIPGKVKLSSTQVLRKK